MGYWYIEGADGRHYCWSKQATDLCPNRDGMIVHDLLADNDCGLDVQLIAKSIQRSHRQYHDDLRKGYCGACGMRLERLGYDTWVEEPNPSEVTQRVADRLGYGGAWRRVDGSLRRFKLKREAEAYAREQAAVADLVGAE